MMALLFVLLFNIFFNSCTGVDLSPAQRLDTVLLNLALRSYHIPHHPKTGELLSLYFPTIPNISATATRFRSGSLRRHGAEILEFSIAQGMTVEPYSEHLLVLRQRLDSSTSYYPSPTGYRVASPILGLLFYDESGKELRITSMSRPMSINFSAAGNVLTAGGATPVCCFWDLNGGVRFTEVGGTGALTCMGYKEGHFGLVVEEERPATAVKKWKMAAGGALGGAVGLVLLALLAVAVVRKTKRGKKAEMERRAYEEEALEVAMVGHVRAPVATAAGVRTLPVLESKYGP